MAKTTEIPAYKDYESYDEETNGDEQEIDEESINSYFYSSARMFEANEELNDKMETIVKRIHKVYIVSGIMAVIIAVINIFFINGLLEQLIGFASVVALGATAIAIEKIVGKCDD